MTAEKIKKELKKLTNPKKAITLARFFKTGKGEYSEGDLFLGITVPEQRKIAIKNKNIKLNELKKLIKSKFHEERLTALLILVVKFQKKDPKEQEKIYNFYLKYTKLINNWDLVDLSAPKIVGAYLLNKKIKRETLYKLIKSKNIWERRIAILSTYTFIKNNDFQDCLNFCELLLQDKEDLIHKASGWMLREIGKIDQEIEENFLKKYYQKMPRTMLRYAIEKFSEQKRKFYLKK